MRGQRRHLGMSRSAADTGCRAKSRRMHDCSTTETRRRSLKTCSKTQHQNLQLHTSNRSTCLHSNRQIERPRVHIKGPKLNPERNNVPQNTTNPIKARRSVRHDPGLRAGDLAWLYRKCICHWSTHDTCPLLAVDFQLLQQGPRSIRGFPSTKGTQLRVRG